jgi:hypothetical protein
MPTLDDYYRNSTQYALEDWNTAGPEGDQQAISYNPGYAEELLALRGKVESGQASAWDREWFQQQVNAAMGIPLRDVSRLTYNAGDEAPDRVSGGSPDLGRLLLTLQDRMRSGTATPQERDLFKTTYTNLANQHWRASVPQESDAQPFGIGDNLIGALGTLALGATGGLAAAPLAAGGAGLTTTLGSLGTLAGVAGTAASTLGSEMDEEWLQKLGLGLGAAGGIAGGVGGLAKLWSSGVTSLSDAARLASTAGRVVGGVGAVADNDVLREAGGWLGTAGQLGSGVDTISNVFGDGVGNLTDAARLASGVGQVAGAAGKATGNRPLQQAAGLLGLGSRLGGNVQGLLGQANQAQQRGRALTDEDWLRRDWRLRPATSDAVLATLRG